MKRILVPLSIVLFTACGMAHAAKPDLEAAKKVAVACDACHSPDGNATIDPQYPRLAGQYRDYLVNSLHEYKNGKRTNLIMAGFVAPLSDQDIENLAAYYASMPGGKLVDLHKRVQGD